MIEKYYRSNLNLLNVSMQLTGIKKYANKYYDLPLQLDSLNFYKKNPNEVGVWGYSNSDVFQEFQSKITNEILKNKDYSKELENRMIEWFDDYYSFVKSVIDKDINNLSIPETIEILKEYLEKSFATIPPAWAFDLIGWSFTKILDDKLKEINQFSQENAIVLSSYGLMTIFTKERIAFLEMLKENKDTNNFTLKLKEHYEEWNYIGMESPLGEPFSLEYFEKLAREYTKEKIDEELLSIIRKQEQELKDYNNLVNRINPSNELLDIIDVLRTWVYHKNYERILIHKYVLLGIELLSKLCKRLEIPKGDEIWLTVDELIEFYYNKQELLEAIEQRKKEGYTIRIVNSIIVLEKYTPEESKQEKTEELTGLVASKGEVKGIVRIITELKTQSSEFKAGEILVTNMTTPDYLPLMKKAKAVVTNEGTILCHAAIVSRELGIPCVVGVKNATQILKNGDNIEIKNNKGVGLIEKIKKA